MTLDFTTTNLQQDLNTPNNWLGVKKYTTKRERSTYYVNIPVQRSLGFKKIIEPNLNVDDILLYNIADEI
jgi:hypothetical protein